MTIDKPKRERCRAKTRSGKPCQQWPMRGKKRCRIHGGKSTGPPKNNNNALKHGIYSKAIADNDIETYEQIEVGTLDAEIKIIKLQLTRALEAQRKFEEAVQSGEAEKITYEPHEIRAKSLTKTIQNQVGDQAAVTRTEITTDKEAIKKHPDYRKIIFQLSGRIAKLELTRVAIANSGGGENNPIKIDVTIKDEEDKP